MVSEIITNSILKPQMLILFMFAGFVFFFREEIRGRIAGSDKEDKS
jgi:hypothetical protein